MLSKSKKPKSKKTRTIIQSGGAALLTTGALLVAKSPDRNHPSEGEYIKPMKYTYLQEVSPTQRYTKIVYEPHVVKGRLVEGTKGSLTKFEPENGISWFRGGNNKNNNDKLGDYRILPNGLVEEVTYISKDGTSIEVAWYKPKIGEILELDTPTTSGTWVELTQIKPKYFMERIVGIDVHNVGTESLPLPYTSQTLPIEQILAIPSTNSISLDVCLVNNELYISHGGKPTNIKYTDYLKRINAYLTQHPEKRIRLGFEVNPRYEENANNDAYNRANNLLKQGYKQVFAGKYDNGGLFTKDGIEYIGHGANEWYFKTDKQVFIDPYRQKGDPDLKGVYEIRPITNAIPKELMPLLYQDDKNVNYITAEDVDKYLPKGKSVSLGNVSQNDPRLIKPEYRDKYIDPEAINGIKPVEKQDILLGLRSFLSSFSFFLGLARLLTLIRQGWRFVSPDNLSKFTNAPEAQLSFLKQIIIPLFFLIISIASALIGMGMLFPLAFNILGAVSIGIGAVFLIAALWSYVALKIKLKKVKFNAKKAQQESQKTSFISKLLSFLTLANVLSGITSLSKYAVKALAPAAAIFSYSIVSLMGIVRTYLRHKENKTWIGLSKKEKYEKYKNDKLYDKGFLGLNESLAEKGLVLPLGFTVNDKAVVSQYVKNNLYSRLCNTITFVGVAYFVAGFLSSFGAISLAIGFCALLVLLPWDFWNISNDTRQAKKSLNNGENQEKTLQEQNTKVKSGKSGKSGYSSNASFVPPWDFGNLAYDRHLVKKSLKNGENQEKTLQEQNTKG
jgi:hypothetical protein